MILVDVYIPSLDEVYDFKVDETAKIINVVQEISEMICKKYKTELNEESKNFFLCSVENGEVLNSNSTLAENKIYNGSRLFIV
ncbi:MAG: hypothetical protein NC300_08955 [Bacteroidales bacterium]|nr:hypothetical protein [Clostridium sp.]MCM1204258.1 hypothetical protein [Bacteroidales bacterium]